MRTITVPEGADLVFDGLEEGDEDFFSEQTGHLNISKAYRDIQRFRIPPIPCHVRRDEIPVYRKLRDVDPDQVHRLKMSGLDAIDLRPVLLAELQRGSVTLIDGVHRLIAKAELDPQADPIRLKAYVVPHDALPYLKINVYFTLPNGQKHPLNHEEYMKAIWGKYTSPENSRPRNT